MAKAAALKTPKKPTLTRDSIVNLEDTGHTLADIAALLREPHEPQDANAGRKVPREALRVAEAVFQYRLKGQDRTARANHILDLARAIVSTGTKGLEPILVLPVGRGFYIMDGHHRLAAYDTAGWRRPIPARVFQGTLEEAVREALRANSRTKLPMSRADKTAAAWDFVRREADISKAELVELTGVSTGTIANMRTVLRALKAAGTTSMDEIRGWPWERARSLGQNWEHQPWSDDWVQAKADVLVEGLTKKHFAASLTAKNAEVVARALGTLDSELPLNLLLCWYREHREAFEEAMEELRADQRF